MEALHILWLCSSPSNTKPTLFIANHINIGLCPFQKHREQLRLAHPLRNLRPEDIVQLLFGWCCRNDSWIWETGYEPKKYCCLKTSLSYTLSRFNTDLRVCRQISCSFCLPFIRFKVEHLPEEHNRIISPQRYAFIKEFRELNIIHLCSLLPLLLPQLRPMHEQPHCPCFLRLSSAFQVSASQVLQ